MDPKLTEEIPLDEVKERLNNVLPEGIKVLMVYKPVKKHTEIALAEYNIHIEGDGESLLSELDKFLSKNKILVEKKTKRKGVTTVDIKPNVEVVSKTAEVDRLVINMRLPAGTQINFNPNLFLEAFLNESETEGFVKKIERTKIICSNGKEFL
jgi:radical SAM-linked protein